MYLRIFWSSMRRSEKLRLFAYQLLSQGIMIPVRKPVGRTFCPMNAPVLARVLESWPLTFETLLPRSLLWLVGVRKGNANVGVAPLDRIRGAACARHVAFHDRSGVDARFDHHQVLDAAFAAVLGVAQGALEDRLDEAGRAV